LPPPPLRLRQSYEGLSVGNLLLQRPLRKAARPSFSRKAVGPNFADVIAVVDVGVVPGAVADTLFIVSVADLV
jgi:hypothetical protein